MTNPPGVRAILGTLLLLGVSLQGCGQSQSNQRIPDTTVANMQDVVAQILKKDPSQIDVTMPLYTLGANDADVFNIVMAVEGTFHVDLPSSEIGMTLGDIGKSLTVQKLAEVASKQPKTND
jgi:acyl carrier protein